MKQADDSQACLRQAALSLHALREPDRAWILDALPPDQARPLRALIEELRELGIASDPELVGALLPAPPPAPPLPQSRLALDAAGVGALARLLEGEPEQVVAALMSDATWPWRAQLLPALGGGFEEEARTGTAAIRPAPAFRAAVRQVVQTRIGRLSPAAARERLPVWRRWRDLLRAGRWA